MDDIEESYRPTYKGLRDYHLRSALCNMTLTHGFRSSHKATLSQIQMFTDNFDIIERDPTALLGTIFCRATPVETYAPEIFLAGQLLSVESRLFSSMPQTDLMSIGTRLSTSSLLTKFFGPSQLFQNAIICSNALAAGKELPKHIHRSTVDSVLGVVSMRNHILGLTVIVAPDCFGVTENGVKLSVHHIDHLKNWADKTTERFNIEMSCILGSPINPVVYPSIDFMHTFWALWDVMLERQGNRTYQMIKIFESMCVGVLLERHPNCNINSGLDFLQVTITDFLKESMNRLEDEKYVNDMKNFLLSAPDQLISQCYGLYRSWGHPIVSPKKGMEKVMRLATKDKVISSILPLILRRIFMFKYSKWFKSTKGQYPLITFPQDTCNPIVEVLINDGPLHLLSQYMTSVHWDDIRFQKNIEVPLTFNLAEMVSDKAVSPDRSGIMSLVLRGKGMYDANLRRGVLQWLSRDPVECAPFLQKVNDTSLDINDLVIGLYQKEREVNQTPRMFALMSHNIRCYAVVTEAMIAEDILPAFPSITMTNDLLSLSKKIYSVSHRQAENTKVSPLDISREITTIVNIDFEKWNLNFRKETTSGVFSAMGDLYGMENLFNRTYDIFRGSYIYLADGSYIPQISPEGLVLEPPFSYTGHKGGLEGLRQKGWTVFTACGLELVCSRHNCKYSIMGQGDNQVLILTFRTYHLNADKSVSNKGKRLLSGKFKLFMADLTQTFESLGLPIKALETWSSENLFLYGKVPTLRGVPLCMSLKKICRAYYLANEEIMTLDCCVATVQSNAMAACMSDVTSTIPYAVYKVQIILAIKAYYEYHVLLGRGAFEDANGGKWDFTTSLGTRSRYFIDSQLPKQDLFAILSWFPKILGGISVCCWPDFMMRGFPDKVSSALYVIRELIRCCSRESLRQALQIIYSGHINPEKNWTLLVEDPCALNLVVPVDARASVKQSVQELFSNMTEIKNHQFSSLFRFNGTWDREEFCRLLCKGEILHPRFLHDVVAATVGGYVDSIVSKISKSSTIGKLALNTSLRNPGRRIERHEQNYMNYLVWKTSPSNMISSGEMHLCPTLQASALRLRSWDKILEGVTVPFPLSFISYSNCTSGRTELDLCDQNYILVAVPESMVVPNVAKIMTLGRSPPYLGSVTKEKIGADPVRQVFGKEPLISRPLSLLRVINWFVPIDSLASQVISKLLTSVSDIVPENYVSREMGITGSEAHRYRDQALKHGVMSANLYTLGSHMHISTDTWIKYTRGAENYTINYQALLCSIQALVGQSLLSAAQVGTLPPREYHFHESCSSCITPLTEEFHDLQDTDLLQHIPSDPLNPYLWVQEESISKKYKADPFYNSNIPEIMAAEYRDIPNKRMILTQWIIEDITEDIYNGDAQESVGRLLTTRDYPRVMYKKLGYAEVLNELSRYLIYHAGVMYSQGKTNRVVSSKQGRELAADDIMKSSPLQVQGLIGFFTWPEKFREIYLESESSLFPDTNPPGVLSSCRAMRGNLRDRIKSIALLSPNGLILRRTDKNPSIKIKTYWYAVTITSANPCPQCLTCICLIEKINVISDYFSMRCSLHHLVLTAKHKDVRVLTASEDKVLKDSFPFIPLIIPKPISCWTVVRCPTSVLCCRLAVSEVIEIVDKLTAIPRVSNLWRPVISLPTNTYYRVTETLSILRFHEEIQNLGTSCLILGDGLGMSSQLLAKFSPHTRFYAASLQDSEHAIPQSYAHTLIPENPDPSENINYELSRYVFNDYTKKCVAETWSNWTQAETCWCEIEVSDDSALIISNIVSSSDYNTVIWRCEAKNLETLEKLINWCSLHSIFTSVYLAQSFNVLAVEVLIIMKQTHGIADAITQTKYLQIDESYHRLYYNGESLLHGEYLRNLEDGISLSKMIKRCDIWFSEIGLTHLLGCGKYWTPLWWDLQTGKISKNVENLGENKKYYLYKSDEIAITARLVALAISLVQDARIREEEILKYEYWKLSLSREHGKIGIAIRRVREKQDFGLDHLLIIKYIPILNELNTLNNRKILTLPRVMKFSTNSSMPGFIVGPSSWKIPSTLPEVLY
ncbi:TPA_asm: L [Lupinus gammacytorhabdovirus 1]|nr:TPA_asm: L [Lupinus gammacytorhabdovirus 1]